jgi:diguanylate cyclase (GGDEF)-like protein
MDRRTLFSMQAGLLIFLGFVLLIAFWKQRRTRRDTGADWFAAAYFCAGVGLGLQAERGLIAPLWSILFGNGLFMMFYVLINRAIATTTKQSSRMVPYLLALNLATVANYAYYTYVQPNVMLRTVEAVLVTTVMNVTLVVLSLRSRDRVIQPALRAMSALIVIHVLSNIVRIAGALHVRNADAWYSWFGIVTIAGLALSFLWIGGLRMQHALETSAMTDPLTGLFNRRALEMVAVRELQRTARKHQPCSALMMDIDRFKIINDQLGHAAGDSTLCAVAAAVQASLRASDVATRLGGDEFFVLLPDANEDAASLVVARLRHAIAQLRLQTMGGLPFRVAVSIGQVTMRGTDTSVEDLLHASDIVLYREKQISRLHPSVSGTQADSPAGGAQVHPSNA